MVKTRFTPEISYEQDDGGQLGNLPLIHVPGGEEMPPVLFIWEARETGEFEPGPEGEEVPVVQWDLRQYCMMDTLRAGLTSVEYDRVRTVLGLEPMASAVAAGQAISQRVRDAVDNSQAAIKLKKS